MVPVEVAVISSESGQVAVPTASPPPSIGSLISMVKDGGQYPISVHSVVGTTSGGGTADVVVGAATTSANATRVSAKNRFVGLSPSLQKGSPRPTWAKLGQGNAPSPNRAAGGTSGVFQFEGVEPSARQALGHALHGTGGPGDRSHHTCQSGGRRARWSWLRRAPPIRPRRRP